MSRQFKNLWPFSSNGFGSKNRSRSRVRGIPLSNARRRFRSTRGIALVAALVLLVISTLIALSAMRGSAVTERMVFNHDSRTEALMAAEAGAAAFKSTLDEFLSQQSRWPRPDEQVALTAPFVSDPVGFSNIRTSISDPVSPVDHAFFQLAAVQWDDVEEVVSFRAIGQRRIADETESVQEVFVRLAALGSTDPGLDGVLTCENIRVGSAGSNDLFGSFDPEQFDFSNPLSNINDRGILESTGPSGWIRVAGNSRVQGQVRSQDGVDLRNGAEIQGNVSTAGQVDLRNQSRVAGGVAAGRGLTAHNNNRTVVVGDVKVNGDLSLGGQRRIDGSVQVGGLAGANDGTLVSGSFETGLGAPASDSLPSVRPRGCDPFDIDDIVLQVSSAGVPRLGSTTSTQSLDIAIGASEMVVNNNGSGSGRVSNGVHDAETIDFMGRQVSAYNFDDLNIMGRLRVTEGDVLIIVDGDLRTSGGAPRIEVADGANVTFLVRGQTRLGGSSAGASALDVKGDDFFLERNGRKVPRFSLFSDANDPGNSDANDPTAINGERSILINTGDASGSPLNQAGLIYAPRANVQLTGPGGWFGAAAAQAFEVAGGRGFFYNEGFRGTVRSLASSRIDHWSERVEVAATP
ncbi:MAG: PilX N-terminal domain-containing pilus assembly protein [Thioalkalivibrionaceae bacterium]